MGDINIQLYADDTVVSVSGRNLSTLVTSLQRTLNRFQAWCMINKLTLNPSKTKSVVFGTRQALKNARPIPSLYLGGTKIQNVVTFKYLGFTLDSTLTFKCRLADLIKKVMHKKLLLSKVLHLLNTDVALSIYKMMILPYFDYFDVIYYSACSGDLEKLQRLQNKCLKMCLKTHMLTNTKEAHSKAKCAYLGTRRDTHMSNFMHTRQFKPGLFDEREINNRQHDAPTFCLSFPHKETFKRSVLYSGAQVWNALPAHVRKIDDLHAFKANRKKVMIVH